VLVSETVVVPDANVDVAVMLTAPSELMLAASSVTMATPPPLVMAVPKPD
jgi:hypothetical protein